MGSGRTTHRLSQLWQFPLLLISAALFVYAAYLFIDPKPGLTIEQRIKIAQLLIRQDRAPAAIEQLNALLKGVKLKADAEAQCRLLLAESIELAQKAKRISIRENHEQIIDQTRKALALGARGDADTWRRMAESYEALGRINDAIAGFRETMSRDPRLALKWQRKIIELQLLHNQHEEAAKAIEQYLAAKELAQSERAWALGEKAHILVDRGEFQEARQILAEAQKLDEAENGEQGQIKYWLGYCEWKLGNPAEAERLLRVARDLLKVQHPLDADAAYALGRIRQAQSDWTGAMSWYAAVLQSHLDAPVAPSAKLNRGLCRIASGDQEPGLSDLSDLTRLVQDKPSLPASLRRETIGVLRESMNLLSAAGNFQGAMEVLAYEQQLQEKPSAEFFGRLARTYEQRAEQVQESIWPEAPMAEKQKKEQQVRDLRAKAGEAYIAVSKALTLADDRGHGEAMWKGIDLFEKAGDLPRTIAALETFVSERPGDPTTPDALLRLGQSFHAAGAFDKAIEAYRRNEFRYPKSLAASKSVVPLARAYMAQGPAAYGRAEEVLRRLVENNPQITPDAEEFRESLWELANLYYRTGRYEQSVARLDEMMQRYPKDARKGQLLFVTADSYRKSAMTLEQKLAEEKRPTTRPSIDLAEVERARADRLQRALALYEQAIEHYRGARVDQEPDKLFSKLSHIYRADCLYDLGQYAEAIKAYGEAAFRYQDDASVLAAYVQIVNANLALGRMDEAKAATERAKWMLRRMPPESFSDSSLGMNKSYWEQWLKWSGEAGMWK